MDTGVPIPDTTCKADPHLVTYCDHLGDSLRMLDMQAAKLEGVLARTNGSAEPALAEVPSPAGSVFDRLAYLNDRFVQLNDRIGAVLSVLTEYI